MGFFDRFRKKPPPPPTFPPVPAWRPAFAPPVDEVLDRMRSYTSQARDIVCFESGTCVVVRDGLDDEAAAAAAVDVLGAIFNYHPDMNPLPMDDGNILVKYNHPAFNVVLTKFAEQHWPEIDARHLDALATSEVLIIPMSP